MEQMSNSGLLRPPFIPLTDFNNRILSNRTKKEVLTNLYYVHLIQLLMRQTDQQMEQLSDLKGQSPESSAKMPTSGLLPSPSIHWRYRRGGPCASQIHRNSKVRPLPWWGFQSLKKGHMQQLKYRIQRPHIKDGLAESWGRKSETTTKRENGGLWEGLLSVGRSRNVWTTWRGIPE